MQHLDEGTIHSWLDGALSADEAARVDAHVKECRECAAAVAEARGFIAASSRILTALDNAPRGVIPVATPVRRRNWAVWRAAAAVLVVAGGSLVVLKNTGNKPQVLNSASTARASSAAAPAPVDAPVSADGDEAIRTTPEPAPPVEIQGSLSRRIAIGGAQPSVGVQGKSAAKTSAADAVTSTAQTTARPSEAADRNEARARAFKPNISAREGAALSAVAGGVVGKLSAPPGSASPTAAPITPPAAPPALGAVVLSGSRSLGVVTDSGSLKVVGTPRRIGAKVTLYEVATGDTVTLMEFIQARLEAAVVTGTGVARPEQQEATEKSVVAPSRVRADAANQTAADSQHAAGARRAPTAAQSAPRPLTGVGVSDGITTISWTDATTGNEMKLSGRMPVARLQQIKTRIERERAAAAATRKAP